MATEYRYLDLNDTCKGISSLEANKELQPNFVTAKDKKPQRKWFIPFRKVFLLLFIPILVLVSGCRSFRPAEVDHLNQSEYNRLQRVGDFYERTLSWKFQHVPYHLTIKVPVALLEHYANKPKLEFEDWGNYCKDDSAYPYLLDVDRQLYQLVADKHLTKEEFAQFVANFVEAIPYRYHPETFNPAVYDVPRYPITIFLLALKDCKDGTIALNALLSKIGYQPILIGVPDHMATGLNDFPGTTPFVTRSGIDYAYVETTAANSRIGKWPKGVSPDQLLAVLPTYQTGVISYEDLANNDSIAPMAKVTRPISTRHHDTPPQAVGVMDILNEAFGLAFKLNHN